MASWRYVDDHRGIFLLRITTSQPAVKPPPLQLGILVDIREIVALSPVIPVLTIASTHHAVPLARALVAGGLRVLEVTLRTPVALECIEAMRKAVPEAVIGAGTLTKPADLAAAGRAGAHFGISPGLTADLAAACRNAPFPMLPGAMTPSEVIAARQFGFTTLKLFPANLASGTTMLQALDAIFPEVMFCHTGGISRATAGAYLALDNVCCVGGSWLAPENLQLAEDWAAIEALARDAAGLR
jgi:2-dehydro-3-deoxyphosphogluconate aldolase / (4S)-4-hydroxy-2-oxoglutarate aldolase